MVPHGHLKQRPAARAKRAPHVTLSPRASAARARSLKSVSVRRSRPPRYLTLVLQLPGSEILRTRQIAYTKLYTAGMIAFGLFLGLIFFTLLETSRAADFAAGDPWEDAVHAWSDAERRDLRTAFRREMLYSVEHVERLVENQKQIRLLLSTRGLSEYSELDDMETELGTLGRLRESSGAEFGPAAFVGERLRVHNEIFASADAFADRYREMFAGVPHRWPLIKDALRVNSHYGWRRPPFYRWSTKLKFHRGIDLDANRGDPVAAAAAGRVRRVRLSNRGYGNMIHLQHDDGYETLYAHLQSVHVKKDQHIRAGQVIGRAGSSGHSTGPHLHYEVRRNGAHVDPREYLAL